MYLLYDTARNPGESQSLHDQAPPDNCSCDSRNSCHLLSLKSDPDTARLYDTGYSSVIHELLSSENLHGYSLLLSMRSHYDTACSPEAWLDDAMHADLRGRHNSYHLSSRLSGRDTARPYDTGCSSVIHELLSSENLRG